MATPATQTDDSARRSAADAAWVLLLACARLSRTRPDPPDLAIDATRPDGVREAADVAEAAARWHGGAGWRPGPAVGGEAAELLDLYLPICGGGPRRPLVVGHLGQSLDGFIATAGGDSCFVNDPANIVHLHRMRALCDAVLVGGATVRDDDPRLTTRHVSGPHATRVVLDPELALPATTRLFNDGEAPTLVVASPQAAGRAQAHRGHAEVLAVAPGADGRPDLTEVLAALRTRGCHAVFVEGGGVTVSRFLAAGLLDRLQVAVAPVFIGEGRAGVRLPPAAVMADCPRPAHRVFRMGGDVLFDFDLRAPRAGTPEAVLRRID